MQVEFKPGDKVRIGWALSVWPVTKVENGKIWVDTAFGECSYDPIELEYADVPF